MNIVALTDEINPVLHSLNMKERHGDAELIVSCGDLPAEYLEFVVSMLDVPLVNIPGNHVCDDYEVQGGIDLDGRVTSIHELHISGTGGSRRYRSSGRHQYSESEMMLKVTNLMLRLSPRRSLKGKACDILITHSPPYGIHDAKDNEADDRPGETKHDTDDEKHSIILGFPELHRVIRIWMCLGPLGDLLLVIKLQPG